MRIGKKLDRIMKKGKKNWLMMIYEFLDFFFLFKNVDEDDEEVEGENDEEKEKKLGVAGTS